MDHDGSDGDDDDDDEEEEAEEEEEDDGDDGYHHDDDKRRHMMTECKKDVHIAFLLIADERLAEAIRGCSARGMVACTRVPVLAAS